MKYGINQNAIGITCANCGKSAEDKKFCENCGAPLTIAAIAEYEENNQKTKEDVINTLKHIAVEHKTDSLSEILKIYND